MKKAALVFFLLTVYSFSGWANWSVISGTGAYMGERYLGAAYSSENSKHFTEFSYGQTSGEFTSDVEQFNLRYTYSPFSFAAGLIESNILGFGFIVSRWNGPDGFVTLPSPYPEAGYYPMTRYRLSLALSNTWTYKDFTFFIDWALLDQIAIALYNNPEYVSSKDIWSSGFGLRWKW